MSMHLHRITRLILVVATIAGVFSATLFSTTTVQAATPVASPVATHEALYAAIKPELIDEALRLTEDQVPVYTVDADFQVATTLPSTIEGTLDFTFVNFTGAPQETIPFRLYPNGTDNLGGNLTILSASVDGSAVEVQSGSDPTIALVPLPQPVQPGATTRVTLDFRTTIPTDPPGGYGMFALDTPTGVYALAHWMPLLAGWDPVSGWLLDPLSVNGDPVFSNVALFDVTITAPRSLTLVTSGTEIARAVNESEATTRFVSGPSRDFVMAASEQFGILTAEENGVTIRSVHLPGHQVTAQRVLDWTIAGIELYDELFGPYPYREFDVVQIDLQNRAAGVEFPGIVFIENGLYGGDSRNLEFTLVHEIVHQWWYAVVGNNQYQHAFIDEGLTNYSSTIYFERVYGPNIGDLSVEFALTSPYFRVLFGDNADYIVDQPTDDFPSQNVYGGIIYGKAALGFQAIREAIGDDAFFAALQQYYRDFAYEVATPQDLKAAFEQASGQNLDELWRHWFQAAEGFQDFGPEDLQELLD